MGVGVPVVGVPVVGVPVVGVPVVGVPVVGVPVMGVRVVGVPVAYECHLQSFSQGKCSFQQLSSIRFKKTTTEDFIDF